MSSCFVDTAFQIRAWLSIGLAPRHVSSAATQERAVLPRRHARRSVAERIQFCILSALSESQSIKLRTRVGYCRALVQKIESFRPCVLLHWLRAGRIRNYCHCLQPLERGNEVMPAPNTRQAVSIYGSLGQIGLLRVLLSCTFPEQKGRREEGSTQSG